MKNQARILLHETLEESRALKSLVRIDPKGLLCKVGNASVFRLHADRDACIGITHTPKEATLKSAATLELGNWFLQNRPDRDE